MFCSMVFIYLFLVFHSFVPHLDLICSFVLALIPLQSCFVPWSLYICSLYFTDLFLVWAQFVPSLSYVPFSIIFCSMVLIYFFHVSYNFIPRLDSFCYFALALFPLKSCIVPCSLYFCSCMLQFCSSFRFDLFLHASFCSLCSYVLLFHVTLTFCSYMHSYVFLY
jgi:hypothetical protein